MLFTQQRPAWELLGDCLEAVCRRDQQRLSSWAGCWLERKPDSVEVRPVRRFYRPPGVVGRLAEERRGGRIQQNSAGGDALGVAHFLVQALRVAQLRWFVFPNWRHR